jgi:hypothetical protein
MQVSVSAPRPYQGRLRCFGLADALADGAVVPIVSVAVPAEVPEIVTGLVAPNVTVGASWAPDG